MSRHLPGFTWRILAHHRNPGDDRSGRAIDLRFTHKDRVEFDEIVACEGIIHIEQMSDRDWYVSIAGWEGNLHIPVNGTAHVEWHDQPEGPE